MKKRTVASMTIILLALLALGLFLMQRDKGNTTAQQPALTLSEFNVDYKDKKTILQPYSDITEDVAAYNEIAQLLELGVVIADADGQFRPDKVVTAQEAKAIFEQVARLTKHASSFSTTTNAPLTHEQLVKELVQLFQLNNTNESISFKDKKMISDGYQEALTIVAQHQISMGVDGKIEPAAPIDRATFATLLYRAFVVTGTKPIDYSIEKSEVAVPLLDEAYIAQVSADEHLYVRSPLPVEGQKAKTEKHETATDTIYPFIVGDNKADVTVTVRTFKNGDQFVFSTINNHSDQAISVDVFERQKAGMMVDLFRYDRYPLERIGLEVFGDDKSTYPVGLQRMTRDDELVEEKMIGQAYRSKQLTLEYEETGGTSYVRDFELEYEALSTVSLSTGFISFTTLESNGQDIVDSWHMVSSEPLFTSNDAMESWMLETSQNFIKRNKWYTAQGVYTKMATSIEPMPKSEQGFGRSLLMQKEDRALVLYKQQGDRYFENLVNNSFVSLDQFKGDDPYWLTEVTSTYLKGLYNMTAPFIDTRFNEQIALFYLNAGKDFGIAGFKEPLRNYADLLVSRKEAGHIIEVADDAYYISDYFPLKQDIVTHSSMNHILGGLNVLLLAYEELGDEKYLNTANAIHKAIELEKDLWIRDTGDIWYRVNPKKEFAGDDYKHLTLEDLINTYKFYSRIDQTKLPLVKEMIISKATFLSENELGYTYKIRDGLEEIGMLKYLPEGELFTDAH